MIWGLTLPFQNPLLSPPRLYSAFQGVGERFALPFLHLRSLRALEKGISCKIPDCPQPCAGSSVSGVRAAVGRASRGLATSQVPEAPSLHAACATAACTTAWRSRSAGPQVFCTRPSFRKKMQLSLHSWQTSSPFLPWERNHRAVRGAACTCACDRVRACVCVCLGLTPAGLTGHCWEGETYFSFLPVTLASSFSHNSYIS